MTEIKTGTDALRATLKAWSFKINLATVGRDLSIPSDHLEKFIAGGELPPDAIHSLTKLLFAGNAIWDEKLDRLKPANQQEARPLGSGPPPIDPALLPKFSGGPPGPGPKPVTPPKAEPEKPRLRPGWVE